MQQSANNGNKKAQTDLLVLQAAVGQDPGAASKIFQKAAEDYLDKDSIGAFRWMKRSADLGDPIAQLNVGRMFLAGYGLDAGHPELALGYLQRASEQGNAEAMLEIAGIYLNGKGVEPDAKTGMRWLAAAADRHLAAAMGELGALLTNGQLVDRDIPRGSHTSKKLPRAATRSRNLIMGKLYFLAIGCRKTCLPVLGGL